jgi:hypothetical protein
MMADKCKRCQKPLEPSRGGKPRKWCSDACRMRAARAVPVMPELPAGDVGVVDAVKRLVADVDPDDEAETAQAALAIETARMVSLGVVSAVRELRQLLVDMRVARAPDLEAEPSTSVKLRILLQACDAGPHADWSETAALMPPGWPGGDTELFEWLGTRRAELVAGKDWYGVRGLDAWCGAHSSELVSIRRGDSDYLLGYDEDGEPVTCKPKADFGWYDAQRNW